MEDFTKKVKTELGFPRDRKISFSKIKKGTNSWKYK